MVVLPFQSYALPADKLGEVSRVMAERLRADPEIELVDAAPVLAEKASEEWLRADKLLYDGIQAYQGLDFAGAARQLSEAAQIMELTYREFADLQGRKRMREAYLHLGLARLEQGEQQEAEEGFAKAARVDPAFEPDPKTYPASVRDKFKEAKNERTDAAFEAGRERLRELTRLLGVDVVVGGGVRHDASEQGGGWFLELAWVERASGLPGVETVSAPAADALPESVRRDAPRILARLLKRPWPPVSGQRSRFHVLLGPALGWMPGATIREPRGVSQEFAWRGDLQQAGIQGAVRPWESGRFAMEADFTYYLPQPMASRGWKEPSGGVTGRFVGGGALGAHVLYGIEAGRWRFDAGAGLAANQTTATFRSQFVKTGVAVTWFTPVLSLSAQRMVIRGKRLEAFARVRVAAHQDVLGAGPAPWYFQSVASAGVAF